MTDYDSICALNWSTLKHMDVTPAFARHRYDHPDEAEDKAAYVSGRAIHCAILEPKKFDERYTVEPDFFDCAVVGSFLDGKLFESPNFGDMRRTKNKQAQKDWLESLPGSARLLKAHQAKTEWLLDIPDGTQILSQADYAMAWRCVDAVWANEHAMKHLKGAKCEHIVTWEQSLIKCKGRIDALTDRVIDLKTTRRNILHDIERDAATFNYYAQLAWYHDGATKAGLISGEELPVAIFIHATQKSEFVDIAILEMIGETLEFGRRKYQKLLDKFRACNAAEWWPGMAARPVQWVLPDWKVRMDEE